MIYTNGRYLIGASSLVDSPYASYNELGSTPFPPPFANDFLLLDNTNFLQLNGDALDLLGAF